MSTNPLLIFNAPISTTGLTLWEVNGTLVGTRPELNVIAGSNITVTGSDNVSNNSFDLTINGGGGGGGVSGVSFGPLYATPNIALVGSTQFNWNGAGTATVSGALNFTTTNTQTGAFNLEGLYSSLPATPYSFTLQCIPNVGWLVAGPGANAYSACGLFWTDGTKAIDFVFQPAIDAMGRLISRTYTTATSGVANQTIGAQTIAYPMTSLYLKIVDDGTNHKSYYSPDGVNFYQFESVLRGAFLTPTGVGITIQNMGMMVLQYSQGTS